MKVNDQSYQLTYCQKQQIISAWDQMLLDPKIRKGRDLWYLNFMFHQLPGSDRQKLAAMQQHVERVHHTLTKHVVRKYWSEAWKRLRPVFIVGPDLPVPKKEKVSARLILANGGLHMNSLVLLAPPSRFEDRTQHPWYPKQSKLKVPLDEYLRENHRFFENDQLYRIDATKVEKGSMADYTFKSMKNGNLSFDELRILN